MMRATCVLAVLALTATACSTVPWPKKSSEPVAELDPLDDPAAYEAPVGLDPGLGLSPDQRFADIPLPFDLEEDIEKTYVFESSDLRIGRMVYSSRASVNELAQFYIRECPAAEWHLDSILQADGAELIFTKGDERLRVVVLEMGFRRGRRLILSLTPASSGL